jgi:hypothetical protein
MYEGALKAPFCYVKIVKDLNLQQVESNEERQRCDSNDPKGEAKPSHPARPTNVRRRPKGAFLLCKNREGFEPAAGRVERRETATLFPFRFLSASFTIILIKSSATSTDNRIGLLHRRKR